MRVKFDISLTHLVGEICQDNKKVVNIFYSAVTFPHISRQSASFTRPFFYLLKHIIHTLTTLHHQFAILPYLTIGKAARNGLTIPGGFYLAAALAARGYPGLAVGQVRSVTRGGQRPRPVSSCRRFRNTRGEKRRAAHGWAVKSGAPEPKSGAPPPPPSPPPPPRRHRRSRLCARCHPVRNL